MASRYGALISQLFGDIEQLFATELGFTAAFQDDCTVPGQRFGICDFTGWSGTPEERNERESIKFNFWIVSSYESFGSCRDGLIQLTADVRSLIPSVPDRINQRGILMQLGYPTEINPTKRAPITMPNKQQGHLWIGDIVVPMVAEVAIGKTMCGEHR
ncbi:hypothetical protein NIES2135_21220 [Leptolyngbya boryana NIES-2135]|jgi:hypothetical protein|uniref:Uncharacterized protein n=1 Tax=Leptolyngbya boryana NIES-2135 TaxID=1973484 RepID=A0A1Z4JEW4_LEPBY|nr:MULTISPECIES: hypothetical protein [Leptolyngbya]BAY55299.1 hypothetical protein NIES2135_21220 [Leptolyngbya boryana NIES-2135]MBD2369382.1 hypothetical protein [Leptolyngbya sp. FACHB-161]MBD2375616.1 hypothetical protein [Leptolyngbya sp. FACHB-238]MBD2401711.1 hypothetical protein [Leptolyngbya sp. FACHB-239]MBD2406550.1 hypothetical protein [Leptolyngbya sp. FACHB-402]